MRIPSAPSVNEQSVSLETIMMIVGKVEIASTGTVLLCVVLFSAALSLVLAP